MSTIYIVSDYGRLVKNGDVLQLKRGDDLLKTIFPFKTELLLILGKVEITSAAINMLMRHRINTVFCHRNGRFNGRIEFQRGKNVFLRQRQFALLDDPEFSLRFARAVVRGKLRNQLSFMQRISRTRAIDHQVAGAVDRIKESLRAVEQADSIDSLRGHEGMGARCFFSVFRHSIKPDWAVFNGRSMNPPKDNVNAVLSFIYTMVFHRVLAAIEAVGLDSYVGYLHQLNYGKQALAFDLMEEYRTPVGDMLTASLFNLGILKPDDFEEIDFTAADDEHPLPLKDDPEEEGDDDGEGAVMPPPDEPEETSPPDDLPAKRGVLLTRDWQKRMKFSPEPFASPDEEEFSIL
jgi:CRISPR-associated protein Cas1